MNYNNLHLHFVYNYVIVTILYLLDSSLSGPSGSPPELQAQVFQDLPPEAGHSRQSQCSSRDPASGHQQLDSDAHQNPGLSKQLNRALQRAESIRGTGRSASAEDLLERSEEGQMPPQHFRSRSSPTGDRLNQVAQQCTRSPHSIIHHCAAFWCLMNLQSSKL